MRLLTHNMLMCNKKGVQNGFPLKISPKNLKLIYEETEFSPGFTISMIKKLEWSALVGAVDDIRKSGVNIVVEDCGGPEKVGGLEKISEAELEKEEKNSMTVCSTSPDSKSNNLPTTDPLTTVTVPTLPHLPPILPSNYEKDMDFLEKMHFILTDLIIEEGLLFCPESGREFPIERGIPNMLLHDDEI